MKEKIEKTLNIFDNLDFDVWFDEPTGTGFIVVRHRCVTSTVLDSITDVVDLVAVSCVAPDTYNISFMTK